jgi:ribonuclease HI
MRFYAVAAGHATGVFIDWDKAAVMIKDYPGGILASFEEVEDAYAFVKKHEKPGHKPHAFDLKPTGVIRSDRVTAPADDKPEEIDDSPAPADDKPEEIDDSPAPVKEPPAKKQKIHGPEAEWVYIMSFDGACNGNGRQAADAGAGYIIKGLDGLIVQRGITYIGKATNNQAEYAGLEAGLRAARDAGIKKLHVRGDSELVIMQMLGDYKVKSDNLKAVNSRANDLCKNFKQVSFEHIGRDNNKEADALSKQAIAERVTRDFV